MQRILVFQENGSGESKIQGIRDHDDGRISLEIFAIDASLPPVIDEADAYLPSRIEADLVLDFLKHPDLSHDLSQLCSKQGIPVVASGKKLRGAGIFTPPT
jgi:hypothetical protein